MRRFLPVITVAMILALALGATACGTSFSRAPGVGDPPEDILAAAFSASNDMTAGAGGFAFELTFDVDESQIPAEDMQIAQGLLDGVAVSGTFAYADDPMAADYAISLGLAGQTADMGARILDAGFWLSYAGSWYEMPPEAMQMFAGSRTQVDPKEMQQVLDKMGFAPVTWFQDLSVVGEEDLAGVKTIHMAGSPDLRKMFVDVFALMQNKQFLTLVDPTGTLSSRMGPGFAPSPAEFEEAMTQLESMLQSLTIDLWVGVDDSQVRKMAVAAHVAPPPGEDPDGLLGIDLSGSMWLDSINQPLAIEAPTSSLPFTELESAITEHPGPLGMFMGGFGNGGAGVDSQTVY